MNDRASSPRKTEWEPTEQSFKRLLDWLDGERPTDGESYLDIRRRLVNYFDRKGCLVPDELADETLSRVQRRLDEEGIIKTETPAKFCYTLARYVFLEYLRSKDRRDVPLDADDGPMRVTPAATSPETDEEAEYAERAFNCLDRCAATLDREKQEMVFGYYQGRLREKIENRRRLAKKFGITVNALTIRTFRIRERLEKCVRECVEKA